MARAHPHLPAAEALGLTDTRQRFINEPSAGRRQALQAAFEAGDQFANPVGVIQGGFLAAMLDDTLGPALVATLPENQFAPTLDLHVQFLRPARPGRLLGRGRIVQRGKDVCFLAGELIGTDGKPVAVATATARIQSIR
ncbi:PaaI family thioesterase [Streptomyces sp. NBC_01210]|uniref:PaaI family thioesterase n=1 Tax=Streptomyces sp. NBC_01210 TaxID=2903774 RepID=UPI002E137F50|nr:PaaI family thioesterase [Streptomyces sp. NBC_01210]